MEFYKQLAIQLGYSLLFGGVGFCIGAFIRYHVDKRRGKL